MSTTLSFLPHISSMGFPSICYGIIFPAPLAAVFGILDCVKSAFSSILHLLGGGLGYSDGRTDLSPAPYVYVSPSSIKKRLPTVEFGDFSRGSMHRGEGAARCAVCLGTLEPSHEVRELGNCRHAFHLRCIDEWVDVGQVTCPLCRADLLPAI